MLLQILIDIIFRYTETKESSNWFKDWGKDIIGYLISIFGFIITVILFYKAYSKNRKIESDKKDEESYQKLNYFASLIIQSNKIIESQIQSLKITISKFEEGDPYTFYTVNMFPIIEIKRITEKLNLEEYYLAYLSKFSNSKEIVVEYQNLISSFDYFNSYFQNLESLAMINGKENFEFIYKFNPLLHEFRGFLKNVGNFIKREEPDYLDDFEAVVKMFEKVDDEIETFENEEIKAFNNMAKFDKVVLKPMLEIIVNIDQKRNHSEELVSSFKFKLIEIGVHFDLTRKGLFLFLNNLKEFVEKGEKSKNRLAENSKRLIREFDNLSNKSYL